MTRLRLVLALLLVACSKQAEPSPEPAPTPPATKAASPAVSDVAYTVPGPWESVATTSPMRKASFKVPRASGDAEDGDLSVSDASGGVDQNIKRWAGQFGNATPKKETRSPNGLKVTVVELSGTYAAMGGAAKDHYMLLGAVVEGSGDQLHFFKLVGPEKTVSAAKKDFDAFVASFHAK